jgi:hypothetical protein
MNDAEIKEGSGQEAEIQGPKFVDGEMYFSTVDLLRYDLIRTKIESAAKDLVLVQNEADAASWDYQTKLRALSEKKQVIGRTLQQLKGEFDRLRGLIEEKYKLDMAQTSYDDVSGRLTNLNTLQGQN